MFEKEWFKIIVFDKLPQAVDTKLNLKVGEVYGVTINKDNPLLYDLIYAPAEPTQDYEYILSVLRQESKLPSDKYTNGPIICYGIDKHQLREWYDNKTISVIHE